MRILKSIIINSIITKFKKIHLFNIPNLHADILLKSIMINSIIIKLLKKKIHLLNIPDPL